MSSDARLEDLLARWRQAAALGPVDLDALCADCPDLRSALTWRVQRLLGEETGHHPPTEALPPPAPTNTLSAPTLPTSNPSSMLFSLRLPGYALLEELGRGGMGVVYKARQLSLNRIVALKTILHADLASADDRSRFLAEAEAAAAVHHPNIAQVFELGTTPDGLPYFALEYCANGSLEKKLDGTPLPPLEAARLIEGAARGIQHAHDKGIIHRDLKPGNILLDEGGRPKVTDFGLARRVEASHRLTRTGAIVGTPSYMPPEQATGQKKLGPATDVYSLGALLYECLTGRPPFKAATALETLAQVVSDDPAPPRQLNANVPPDLEKVCLQCLRKEPDRRYQSARELAEDLKRWQVGEPVLARPVGALERLRKWARRSPAVAALAATVAGVLLLGVTISTLFALHASRSADEARKEAKRADESARAAERSRQLEVEARHQADRDREQANREKQQADEARKQADQERTRAETALNLAEQRRKQLDKERRAAIKARDEAEEASRQLRIEKARADGQLERAEALVYASKLQGALREWELGNVAIAHKLLDSCRLDYRGWEHRYLRGLFDERQVTLHQGGDQLNSLALSGDGRALVAARSAGVALFDAPSGELKAWLGAGKRMVTRTAVNHVGSRFLGLDLNGEIYLFDGNAHRLIGKLPGAVIYSHVAFCSDGRIVALTDRGALRWFDAATGRALGQARGPGEASAAAAFNGEGSLLLTVSFQGQARIWGCRTGRLLREQTIERGPYWRIALSPDGSRIAITRGKLARVYSAGATRAIDLHGHAELITQVAFSPDGARLGTTSYDETARVWSLPGEKALLVLRGHDRFVTHLAFSPDGSHLYTTGLNRELKLWDVRTMPTPYVGLWAGRRGPLPVLSVTGRRAASFTAAGSINLHDLATGRYVLQLGERGRRYNAFGLSPDGAWLLAAHEVDWRFGVEGALTLYDAQRGRPLLTLERSPASVPTCLALSRQARRAVAGTSLKDDQSLLHLFDLDTGKRLRSLPVEQGKGGDVTAVAISADGAWLAAGTANGTVTLFDSRENKAPHVLEGHSAPITCLAFSPDGARLVSGSWDKALRVWDTAEGKLVHSLTQHTGAVYCVALSPDGERIVSGSADQTLRVWGLRNGEELLTLRGHVDGVTSLSFSADGTELVSLDSNGTLRTWRTGTPSGRLSLVGHVRPVTATAISPDGKVLVSASEDATVRIWDVQSGQEVRVLKGHRRTISSLAFSPDGKYFVSGSLDHTAMVWDAKAWRRLHTLKGHTSFVHGVAFSPDRTTIATAGADDVILLWDAATGRQRARLTGHKATVTQVAFSPDRIVLASADRDGTVKLWSVRGQQELYSITNAEERPASLAFDRIGTRLTVRFTSGLARTWETEGGTRAAEVQNAAVPIQRLADGREVGIADNDVQLIDRRHEADARREALRRLTAPRQHHADWHQAELDGLRGLRLPHARVFHIEHLLRGRPGDRALLALRASLLDDAEDWALPRLARLAALSGVKGHDRRAMLLHATGPARALLQLRAGAVEEAIDALERSKQGRPAGAAPVEELCLALAHCRRGEMGQARANFATADRWDRARREPVRLAALIGLAGGGPLAAVVATALPAAAPPLEGDCLLGHEIESLLAEARQVVPPVPVAGEKTAMSSTMLLALLLPAVGPPPAVTVKSWRYVRPAKGGFVVESHVTEVRSGHGVAYSSRTDRGAEKMTLTIRFDAKGRATEAAVAQVTKEGEKTASVVIGTDHSALTRGGKVERLAVKGDVVVTTAPDWSDIFQVIARYDRGKGGKQSFAGLWFHPVQPARELTFTVEPEKDVSMDADGKKVALKRYRVVLRSGAYLVWADAAGRVYKLMPPGKPAAAVILEGLEKATEGLR